MHIVVVDDGSSDATPRILDKCREKFHNITVIRRKNRGYSALGTYIMADVYNSGMQFLLKQSNWEFVVIIGADTVLPPTYIEDVITRMGKEYAVAGGRTDGLERQNLEYCSGSGRIIHRTIMKRLGGYPRLYCWEDSVFNVAWMLGYKTGHFPEIFYHQRKGGYGSRRSYIGWGRSMKQSGYHPLHLIARFLNVIILDRELKQAIQFLVGYFAESYPKGIEWIEWRRIDFKRRLTKRILSILP